MPYCHYGAVLCPSHHFQILRAILFLNHQAVIPGGKEGAAAKGKTEEQQELSQLRLLNTFGDWVHVIKAEESDETRKARSVMQCWDE